MKRARILLSVFIAVILMTGCGLFNSKFSGEKFNSVVSEIVEETDEAIASEKEGASLGEVTETIIENAVIDVTVEVIGNKDKEANVEEAGNVIEENASSENLLSEDGEYSSKDEVALYIHTYGHLPSNYITKKEAEKLGWTGGGLDYYKYGAMIGGSYFGNYEGALPSKDGREYHECDIDTLHKTKRGSKRLVYSNDGLIYYTKDHYESFELLYGEE